MIRARITTPWGVDDIERDYPQVALDYPMLEWVDVTIQPRENIQPDPNAYTVEAILHEDTYAEVEADPNYIILFSDTRSRTATLTLAETTEMTNRLVAMGYQLTQVTDIVQVGRARGEVADDLIAQQRAATP